MKKELKNKEGLKSIDAEITVEEIDDLHVAYVRYIGPYKGNAKLFEGLFEKFFPNSLQSKLLQPVFL